MAPSAVRNGGTPLLIIAPCDDDVTEEVVPLMILLVAVIGLAVAAALALWPAPNARSPEAETGAETRGPFWGALHSEPEPLAEERRPSSLEGVLVDQLIKGDISRRQYLRAVESIAARDEERHPMSIPRDDLPGACA